MAIRCTNITLWGKAEQQPNGQARLSASVAGITFHRAVQGRMRQTEPLYVALRLCGGTPGPFSIAVTWRGPDSTSDVATQQYQWPEDGRWSTSLIMMLQPEIEFVESAVYTISFLADMTPLIEIGLPVCWDDEPKPLDPDF